MKSFSDWLQDRLLSMFATELYQQNERITELEYRMASVNEKLSLINDATNRQGEGLQRVVEVLTSVRDQVANMDTNLAEQLTPVVDTLNAHADRLFEIAADPQEPVPNPEPIPDPGTEVPVS